MDMYRVLLGTRYQKEYEETITRLSHVTDLKVLEELIANS